MTLGAVSLVSAMLPWLLGLGLETADRPAAGMIVVLIVGAMPAVLGSGALTGRARTGALGVLWILAAVDGLAVFGFFEAIEDDTGSVDIDIPPVAGFCIAMLALVATVVGAVLLRVGRMKRGAAARPAQLSSSGLYWWDGSRWLPACDSTPAPEAQAVGAALAHPIARGAPDDDYRWVGGRWLPAGDRDVTP